MRCCSPLSRAGQPVMQIQLGPPLLEERCSRPARGTGGWPERRTRLPSCQPRSTAASHRPSGRWRITPSTRPRQMAITSPLPHGPLPFPVIGRSGQFWGAGRSDCQPREATSPPVILRPASDGLEPDRTGAVRRTREQPRRGPVHYGPHGRPRGSLGQPTALRRQPPAPQTPPQRALGLVHLPASTRCRGYWRAEDAIRPAVVNRKVCGGNRGWYSAETQQILMTCSAPPTSKASTPWHHDRPTPLTRTNNRTTRVPLTGKPDP
jgi:hypothetical protein